MISNLISALFGHRDEAEGQQNSWPAISASNDKAPSAVSAGTAAPEIQIFAGRYGELVAGKVIETTLTELQEILPRPRKRADAYKSLSKRLAAMGVTLVIKREVRHGK